MRVINGRSISVTIYSNTKSDVVHKTVYCFRLYCHYLLTIRTLGKGQGTRGNIERMED